MKKFLSKLLLYALIFWICNMIIGHFLKSYETRDLLEERLFFPKMRWDDYYALEKNIDLLILGSSHAYQGYDPKILTQKLNGINQSFNFGSAAQSPICSYYILREVLKTHHPRVVILDLYVMVFTNDKMSKNGRFNLDSMKPGRGQFEFFRDAFSLGEQFQLLFFPSYIYRDYFEYKLKKLLGRNYLPPRKGEYQGEGFVLSNKSLSKEELEQNNQFDKFKIDLGTVTEKNLEYLEKTTALCKEKNIKLVFLTAPIPGISLEKIAIYADIHQFFEDQSKQLNVSFYDFNSPLLPGIKDEIHFRDEEHLNGKGAEVYSKTVAEVIRDQLKNSAQ